jgi:hypothetical protein
MIKKFVECGGGKLRVSKGGVWGEYCVNEGKEEEKGGEGKSEADRGSCREKFGGERNCEVREVERREKLR